MIVVEDLHWADAASVELLRNVVDHLADRPLMVLLSHRPEARAAAVAARGANRHPRSNRSPTTRPARW